ncbi:hypothetical protein B0H67DRAFT_269444 [Lasiosphaeris hirsuta]|uniref:Uncharacterized protein n=1 Tax=Lasiosphaeris hirsuta TaxID=260670 RepID=A0AA40DT29_9PEZI|nr:hypothetical protein B0H67DRAFT_269444 [Lasiosphaeris hirsuta]
MHLRHAPGVDKQASVFFFLLSFFLFCASACVGICSSVAHVLHSLAVLLLRRNGKLIKKNWESDEDIYARQLKARCSGARFRGLGPMLQSIENRETAWLAWTGLHVRYLGLCWVYGGSTAVLLGLGALGVAGLSSVASHPLCTTWIEFGSPARQLKLLELKQRHQPLHYQ